MKTARVTFLVLFLVMLAISPVSAEDLAQPISAPAPSRNDAIAMFLEWAKVHTQYMGEKPVDTEFRFLIEKWPCKK